ncbi:MAG TPA: sigma factor-like helix-turn-helix DNA-binding protein, partial [Streptosporangiaceae bacterium]|nr:sigma factor-like helix-turn-helix DNA-binding protein [Streptosporangiaceae bacterium]
HRKAIDVTRAAARRAIPVAETPDTATSPAADDAVPDTAAELTQALAKLPAKQKQAIAYHYLAGLPYAEVAAILGGSADAARRAAADGIATLRRSHLGAHQGAPGEHRHAIP